jgi:hypothetical protein
MLQRGAISLVLVLSGALPSSAQTSPPAPSSHSQDFRISGTVVNVVDGQPLAGVEVTISPTEPLQQALETRTGPNGRFVFKSVSRGKYSLVGQRQGFVTQFYQQHDQYSTAIAVGPGLISENLIFAVTPDASISGLVLDEENEPVRSGQLILFHRGADGNNATHVQAQATLDEQGRYHFGHLRPGTYFIAVAAQPWYAQDPPQVGTAAPGSLSIDGQPARDQDNLDHSDQQEATPASPLDVAYPVTYYPAATEPGNAAPIFLHPGERATADVNLRAVPALHLKIRNASSDPSRPTAAVVEQRLLDAAPIPVKTRSQQVSPGVVTITGVAPGHLLLSIRSFTGKEWTNVNREVDLSTDTEIDATESAVGALTIKGTIRLQGVTPLPPGAYIRFFNRESGETFGAQVSEQGEFEIQQTITGPTNYNIGIFNVPKFLVQSVAATGAKVAGHTVLLPRSGAVQLAVTIAEGLGRVDGMVVRAEKPQSEAMVLLAPQGPDQDLSLFRRDQSDSDGTFSLYQVLPGRYTLVAIKEGWDLNWQNPAVLKPYLGHGQVIEVAANQTYRVSLQVQEQSAPGNGATSALQ